jgi:hypothetical protein
MAGSRRYSWLFGMLMLAGLGCLEEFNTLKESQMPRIAEGDPPGSGRNGLGPPVDRFNARALWDEYGSNILQADLGCKGKTLQVEGIIRTVAKDDRGRTYIGFQVFEPATVTASRLRTLSAKEKTWYQEGFPPLVICYLDLTEKNTSGDVKKGQAVQLTGRCLGRVKDPSGFKDYVVVLDSCRLKD